MKIMEANIKNTIAFIDDDPKWLKQHITMFFKSSNRLLLLSQNQNQKELYDNLISTHTNVTIELVDCAREGCWEADIIVITPEFKIETIESIKEVATQKIIIYISDENKQSESNYYFLKKLLPNSKIIFLSNESDHVLSGEDSETLAFISDEISNLK